MIKTVMEFTVSEETCVKWCLEKGLIHGSMACKNCQKAMTADIKNTRWRCNKKGCRMEISMRINTIFSGSRTPISKIMRLLCYWCTKVSVSTAAQLSGVSFSTSVSWYQRFRDVCRLEMIDNPMLVGGPNNIIEIDETSLKKKSKYSRGKRHEDLWLFGGVDRSTGKWFGVITGKDRTKQTLQHLIKKHIRPG